MHRFLPIGVAALAAMLASSPRLTIAAPGATGRVIIDRSHRGDRDLSGFMNHLTSQGWVVAEHPLGGGPVDAAVLAGYDILVVSTASFPDAPMNSWTSPEIAAVRQFLFERGALWMLHHNRNANSANTLAQAFGVNFKYPDVVQDPTNNAGSPTRPIIHVLTPHPITTGVTQYTSYGGDCVTSVPPAVIIARGDGDAYSTQCQVTTWPPTLVAYDRDGRAVFSGDATPMSNSRYPLLSPEEKLLLDNTALWLLGDFTTANAPTRWGSIKSTFFDR